MRTKALSFVGLSALFLTLAAANLQADHIYRASELRGTNIKNDQNENLGEIEDFVVNLRTGEIVYVAMSHGEVLGFGGKLFAVSPRALTLSKDGKYLTMNHPRKAFQDTKGFDANNWPKEPDLAWGGKAPASSIDEKKMDAIVRLSRVTGLHVRNSAGEDCGKAYDFAIDTTNHTIPYVGISYGTTLGLGGKMFAVPLKSMMLQSQKLDPSRREFVVEVRKSDLDTWDGFRNDRWPEEADARFTRK